MTWPTRILALVRKELQILLADPQSRKLVIVPVLLQLVLFPLAATLEVRNNTLAVLDEDGGAAAVELTRRFAMAEAFTEVLTLRGAGRMAEVIDSQRAIAVVRFAPDFSRRAALGEAAPMQIILDGRRSNSSQIAASYIQDITSRYFNERAAGDGLAPDSELAVRHRYNPNLEYRWFILPSLVAIILTVSALILTALSMAREREHGTLEQLLVSPLTPEMIMVGKASAVLLVGASQASVIIAAAVFVYGVPLSGSLALLYGRAVVDVAALAGVGFFISALGSPSSRPSWAPSPSSCRPSCSRATPPPWRTCRAGCRRRPWPTPSATSWSSPRASSSRTRRRPSSWRTPCPSSSSRPSP
jgi:ABC-2 type transport system permease protein